MTPKYLTKATINACTVLGLICCALFVCFGLQNHLFTSQEALHAFIGGCGVFGAFVFIAFQAVQVVIPILPGSLGCLAGVLLFGPWLGFLYNYIGICLGSIAAFLLAKIYGRPILSVLFKERTIQKYESWTTRHFDRLFALAIFLPVAPDDFLCWLAGTTPMTLRRFTAIILLGKPAAIALYSLGLNCIFQWLANVIPV
jgi:uncharacterized membrane protein YdjX (TVP38/TMEM64 family)